MSKPLQFKELQHARYPCPALSPGVCSDSCPLSWWCHPNNSSSVAPFSCPQTSPASESFPVSQLFASGDQSTGASASASVLPMKIQGWFPVGLTGLIFFAIQRILKHLLQEHSLKAWICQCSAFFMVQISHLYITTGKTTALTNWTFVGNWCLCFLIYCLCLS